MKLRPLIIGTFLAVCFWIVSFLWNGVGNAQRQNAAAPNRSGNPDDQVAAFDLLVTFDQRIEARNGQMVIQLFSDAESFRQRKQPVDECFLKLDLSDEILWQFRGLPRGEYAVVAYHDANENWKLDTTNGESVGEKISYSQIGFAPDSKPAFEKCKFPVTDNRLIQLKWK